MSLQTVHFGNWATLYRADFRDVLDSLVGVDAVITDPPYANGSDYGIYQDTQMGLQALIDALMPWIAKNAKRALITPGNANQALYPKPVWTLAWVTPAGTGTGPWGFACWQPVLAYGKFFITEPVPQSPAPDAGTIYSEMIGVTEPGTDSDAIVRDVVQLYR